MTITTEQLVAREVVFCVSSLVATLSKAAGSGSDVDMGDLGAAMDQALELATPIEDWESAAIEDNAAVGCHKDADSDEWCCWTIAGDDGDSSMWSDSVTGAWQEWCESHDLEPYQREVYEHWIVSDWLADLLEAKGEKVDKDLAGLTVWARTTTGQSISMDSVIAEITADLNGKV